MERVKWTDAEVERLAEEVAQRRIDDPEPALMSLIIEAVEQMPIDRRRNVKTINQVRPLVEKVRLRLALLRDSANQPPPPAPPTMEEVLQTLSLDRAFALAFAGLNQNLAKLAERQTQIESLLKEKNMPNYQPQPALPKTPILPNLSPRKPKVVVLGLLNGQAHEVKRQLSTLCEVECISKDIRTPTIPKCDHIFLMADFIDHGLQNLAYNKVPRERVHRHTGGISELVKKIQLVVNP